MIEKKFIKAYCNKYNKYYGIELRKYSGVWKATDFINLSADEFKLLTSEIKQESFETAPNLQVCNKCKSNKIGYCHCAPKYSKCNKGQYNYQCIHCENLKIDYSSATRVGGYKDGDTIVLAQGQEVKLSFNNEALTKLYVGVGWDMSNNYNNIDIDSSVIETNGQLIETTYFGHLTSLDDSIHHHGDNLTGEDIPNADDENITIKLDKVKEIYNQLYIVLNIYKCDERNQTFGKINNLFIKIYDPVTKKTLIRYNLDGNYSRYTALIIGKVYKEEGEWNFKALGKPSTAKTIRELENEIKKI